MARRKKIKIELTTTQIDKLWPFLNAANSVLGVDGIWRPGHVVMGQATVSDEGPGRVRGYVEFVLLDSAEALAVSEVVKGGGDQ